MASPRRQVRLCLNGKLRCLPQGKSPQEVMTPAVADPSKLGYLKLYKMMLDMVRCVARQGLEPAHGPPSRAAAVCYCRLMLLPAAHLVSRMSSSICSGH